MCVIIEIQSTLIGAYHTVNERMDVALWITIAAIVVTSIIFAYIFRSASGKAINNGTYPVDIMYNNWTIFDSINNLYHEIYC